MFKLWMLRLVIINCPTISHLEISRRWENKIHVKAVKKIGAHHWIIFCSSNPSETKCVLCSTLLRIQPMETPRSFSMTVSHPDPLKKNAGKFLTRPCCDKSPWSKVIVVLNHTFLLSCQMNPWNSQINPSPSLRHSKRAKCSSVTKNYTSGNSACYL